MRKANAVGRLVAHLFVLFLVAALAQEAAAMSIREAGRLLGKAQRNYFSGKTDQANEQLKQVEAAIAEAKAGGNLIEKRAAGLLEGRVKSLRKRINNKLGISETETADKPSTKTEEPKKTDAKAGSEKLPGGVSHRLKKVNSSLDRAEQRLKTATDSNMKNRIESAEYSLKGIKNTMAEIDKQYAGKYSPDHPDVAAARKRIDAFEKAIAEKSTVLKKNEAAASAAAEKAEAESAKWIAKLKPYVTSRYQAGYDAEKYFIPGYTADMEDMAKRIKIYSAARADFDAYKKAGLGDAANEELQLIVKELEHNLKTHVTNCAEMAAFNLKEAEKKIDYLTKRAEGESKKIGTGELPLPVSKSVLQEPRALIDRAKGILGADDKGVVEVEKKYAAMIAQNAKLNEARVSETRMIADKFKGKETDALKKKAQEIVRKKYPDAKILRTTVVSREWKEENVIEWTDTTHSALRHRITHSVSAQVAAKRGGDTKIYTVHVAKNRKADGSWTGLYGHIMFEDPILEENVNK